MRHHSLVQSRSVNTGKPKLDTSHSSRFCFHMIKKTMLPFANRCSQ